MATLIPPPPFQCGGLRVLDVLFHSRSSSSVADRVEAAGVLAQITSPWIADNHRIASLDQFVPSMVSALTGEGERERGEGVGGGRKSCTLFIQPELCHPLAFCNPVGGGGGGGEGGGEGDTCSCGCCCC